MRATDRTFLHIAAALQFACRFRADVARLFMLGTFSLFLRYLTNVLKQCFAAWSRNDREQSILTLGCGQADHEPRLCLVHAEVHQCCRLVLGEVR